MSRPPINPEKSNAGIITDPHTLQRVIPESRRADGSVRKQHKVRPGYVPQEDAKLFRGSKQLQMEANALPKGHIVGWVAPSSQSKSLSKSAKKNAKRKEKKEEKKVNASYDDPVRDNWEDEDEEQPAAPQAAAANADLINTGRSSELIADQPNGSNIVSSNAIQQLATDLNKLNVK
ncbi:hypothetical protein Ac2012v2_003879 [Leucoagaricus gongylophorus]